MNLKEQLNITISPRKRKLESEKNGEAEHKADTRVLTEEKILKLTGCNDLNEVEELCLENCNLTHEDLEPTLFNRMPSLSALDVSNNEIETIPLNLKMPELEILNISSNKLTSVEWLKCFPNLLELDMRNNPYLPVVDYYKAVFMLKRIELIDNKGVKMKFDIQQVYTDKLRSKMEVIWKLQYVRKLQQLMDMQERNIVVKEFANFCKKSVVYGPNSLREFRHWRIEDLAKEIAAGSDDGAEEKGKHQSSRNSLESDEKSIASKIIGASVTCSPHRFLQCHGNDSENDQDFTQQVWCCRFHPNMNNIVATCGGETVCITDVITGTVKARFQQTNEEFYSLDWTTFKINSTCSPSILACGGCLGFVHLIHYEQFCCYGYFKAHDKPIQTLSFVPNHSTYLLSAGNDFSIFLWDIGIPSFPDYRYSRRKLAVFQNLNYNPLKLMMMQDKYLLCASEGGLFCWKLSLKLTDIKTKSPPHLFPANSKITFPCMEEEEFVDGLAVIDNDVIATKCAQVGVIFLWRFSEVESKLSKSAKSVTAPLAMELKWSNTPQCYMNITVCKKTKTLLAGDDKGQIWMYSLDKNIPNKGGKSQASLMPMLPEKTMNPSALLPWPVCFRSNGTPLKDLDTGTVYNDICSSFCMDYVVAVADNNLVCIFKSARQ